MIEFIIRNYIWVERDGAASETKLRLIDELRCLHLSAPGLFFAAPYVWMFSRYFQFYYSSILQDETFNIHALIGGIKAQINQNRSEHSDSSRSDSSLSKNLNPSVLHLSS